MRSALGTSTRLLTPYVLAMLVGALGCSSTHDAPTADASAPNGDASAGPMFSMSLDVPAGGEKFMCQLVSFPKSGYVTTESHDMTPGSHHFLLYTTDLTSIPAGEGAVKDCNSNDGSIMNHVRGMFYAAGSPHAETSFPSGVGMPVTQNEVLLLQVHYVNAGATALHANVRAYFTMARSDADIHEKAGILFWYDPFIDLAAGQTGTAQLRCPVPGNITLLSAAPHFHSRGAGYKAYIDTPASPPSSAPFYTTGGWNRSEAFVGPLTIAAGSHIRFECAYDNANGTQEFFQGPSAATNEMCMFIATYYPALGTEADFCSKGMDMYGTGEKGCIDTLTCLGGCSSTGDAGTNGNPSGGALSLSPCLQRCFVDTCSAFSGTVMSMVNCMQQKCSVECGLAKSDAGDGVDAGVDAGGGLCTPCLLAQCGSITTECANEKSCGDAGP